MTEICPEWCIVGDHSSDGEDIVHLAFRTAVPGDDGEVLVEVSAVAEDFSDLSVDVLGEASFADVDDLGELLLALAEAQAALGAIRGG